MAIYYLLASLTLVILAGSCLTAYLFGYEAGRQMGQSEGHERGKKEGAVRAFAVGYDRGKREREEEETEEEEESKPAERLNPLAWLFLVVVTALLLSLYAHLRQRGLF